jgi:hypothetical protein
VNIISLLITIIVVTILVTIVLGVGTYVAYKLRLARQPVAPVPEGSGLRYFVVHTPPPGPVSPEAGSAA